jgi:hypothetical protein
MEAAGRLMPALALFTKSPALFLLALLVFGAAPVIAAKLAALSFPPDDDRRREILGELAAINLWQRPMWAAEQVARAFTEGLPARWRTRKLRQQQVLDRRYYDALRREALLRERERAEFQQALRDLRAPGSCASAPGPAVRSGRHAAPPARRRRRVLLPGVLLVAMGSAFGGLAMLPVTAPPAEPVTPRVDVWDEGSAAAVVALVLILVWASVFAEAQEHVRRRPAKRARASRLRRARSIPVHQRP